MCQNPLFLSLLYSLQLLGSKCKVIISIKAKHTVTYFTSLLMLCIRAFTYYTSGLSHFPHADPSDLITYRRILAYRDHFANHHLQHPSRLYF